MNIAESVHLPWK